MLKSAFSFAHPAAVRFPKGKGLGASLDKDFKEIPLGRGEVLKEGEDLLIALGSMVFPALEAAKRLEQEGIHLTVVNARFAKPLDEELIRRFVKPGGTIITAEEGVAVGGFGSAVRELLDRNGFCDVKFKCIGLPLEVYPTGSVSEIKERYNLDEDGLFRQILEYYK
jgi:1-deoxy-D-xylulose-5-phosphate synthase